jgi:serine/threonine protein kinase
MDIKESVEKKRRSELDFASQTTTCEYCGQISRQDSNFCRFCGAALKDLVPSQDNDMAVRLQPGMQLEGRYTVIKQIGEGGMGRVFLAVDHQGRRYVLKQIRELPAEADQEDYEVYIRSIQREAQILSSLPHPYLPIARDFLITSHTFVIAMDYIEGRTLAEILVESPEMLNEERVLRWSSQVCDALTYLHSKTPPIIHRNIKPKNIILESGENERVRLIGFGLARYYVEGLDRDEDNFGTKGFSPPEQYGTAQTDARSDIFSLGATMFALLTKHDTDEFFQVEEDGSIRVDFPDPSALIPRLSFEASQVINKALMVLPENRFQSAEEMKFALSKILTRESATQATERFELNQPMKLEETRYCEFKEVKGGHPMRAIWRIVDQYAVAFLNSEGGRIFWGVRDSDRVIVGVKATYRQRDEIRRAVMDKVMRIQPAISPSAIQINFHPVYGAGNPLADTFVIEVVVPRALTRFLYFTADGEVYVKTEAGKKRLSGSEIQDEIIRRLHR